MGNQSSAHPHRLPTEFSLDVLERKRDVKQAVVAPNGPPWLRDFIVEDSNLLSMVKVDNPKRARESYEEYHGRCVKQITTRFCSAPSQLTVVRARDENGETLSLLRLESSKAKQVHLGLLIAEARGETSARFLVERACGSLRREFRKRRVRIECLSQHEKIFSESCFRRLAIQDALKNFSPGHPKRLVVMERKLSRWDEAWSLVLLLALARSGKARPLGAPPIPPIPFLQKLICLAAGGRKGEFWPDFLERALLLVYF